MKAFESLGSITECLDSKRVPLKEQDRSLRKGDIPYYGANGQVDWIDDYLFNERLLLLAEDGGAWGQDKKCAYIIEGKSWVNNHAHVLRSNGKVELNYLYYYLNHTDLNSYITGTTRGKLNRTRMNDIKVPLSPLSEQKQIVQTLDTADTIRQKRKEQLNLLDDYLKSVFFEMFGDPIVNLKRWNLKTVVEVAEDRKGSIKCGPFGSQLLLEELKHEGIPVYGIDNVQTNAFVWAKPKFIDENKFQELRAFEIKTDDVLISRTGTVGRACLAPPNIPKSIIGPNLLKVTLNQDMLLPIVFSIALNFCKSVIQSIKIISPGATVPVFNTTNLKSLKLAIPPIELQQKFASIVKQVEQTKQKMHASLDEMDNHFNALMQRYFG